jgi:hypothetical protein
MRAVTWLDYDVWLEASVTWGTLDSQMWCVHSGVALVIRCYCDTSVSLIDCLNLWSVHVISALDSGGGKIRSRALDHSEVTLYRQESFPAMCQPIDTVACRPVAGQWLWDKKMYKSHCWLTASQTNMFPRKWPNYNNERFPSMRSVVRCYKQGMFRIRLVI